MIHTALGLIETRLETAADLPDLVQENTPYRPELSDPHIRVNHLPGQTRQINIGVNGLTECPGLTQLTIVSQPERGAGEATQLGDRLIRLFMEDRHLMDEEQTTDLRIMGVDVLAQKYQPDGNYLPVMVRWRAYWRVA